MTYAPVMKNPYATSPPLIPGMTMAPGQTIPPYATPAPGHTFGPGILPGQTLAPGMTVPFYLTPAPGQTYGPNTLPPPLTPAPLIPGRTLSPGQTIPPYVTPVPGQTFAPGIAPGRTLAPGVTVPFYLTPAPGEIYAPMVSIPPVPLVPGKTLSPGQTLPPYLTPVPGQTFGPGIVPGHTLAPGLTVPLYLTPGIGQTYGPNTSPASTPAPLIPGYTLPYGQTIPSYITPAPGNTFGPGVVPGHTLAPGMTVPPYLTPLPGFIYAPDPTVAPVPLVPGHTLSPGQTLPPDLTPAPGQTFGPGIQAGSTLAPGVTVPPYLTPLPGQTYGPYGTIKPVPLVPGWTLSPGQTLPPFITPAPGSTFGPEIKPGQTLAPGVTVPSYLTPAPGQIYAPNATPKPVALVPGRTLAPGQTLPPYITPALGSTFGPGIVLGYTLAPGVTVPPYLTPAPGQTYGPHATPQSVPLVPGHTLAPARPCLPTSHLRQATPSVQASCLPGQTYAPNTTPPPAAVNINIVPPKLSGCVYKGALYQQGQRWTDGCDYSCVCEDGTSGRYRCTPKCLIFDNLDSRCILEDDPNDPCCKTPVCPALPNGQVITVVANIGQGLTGYGLASYPVGSGSGTPTISTGVTSVPSLSSNTCVYKGKTYQQDAKWEDGCQYICQCIDAQSGFFTCTDLCPNYHNLPSTCRLIPDPNNNCCQTYVCDVALTTVSNQLQGGVPTPASGVDYCVYNNRYYRQGEEWQDGCSLRCRCEDAVNKFYQCSARCASFSNVPLGCTLIPDIRDPQCCKIPECDSATGAGGSLSGITSPLGIIGTYASNSRPTSIALSATSTYKSGCDLSRGHKWV
ncbi:hypothetical protein C0Q70_19667 [Pomacea canaliculata]|uniref:VWFC domain-containing protein n=1 Tax=Pomacea canaliculata TaxID=400727 RepID=A0A2T7NK02_POMCA|nr:hypothetical protein C0Q70_19667 [Pomacea canaliculata]